MENPAIIDFHVSDCFLRSQKSIMYTNDDTPCRDLSRPFSAFPLFEAQHGHPLIPMIKEAPGATFPKQWLNFPRNLLRQLFTVVFPSVPAARPKHLFCFCLKLESMRIQDSLAVPETPWSCFVLHNHSQMDAFCPFFYFFLNLPFFFFSLFRS